MVNALLCRNDDGSFSSRQLCINGMSLFIISGTICTVAGSIIGGCAVLDAYGLINAGLLTNLGFGGSWGFFGGSLGPFLLFVIGDVALAACLIRCCCAKKNPPIVYNPVDASEEDKEEDAGHDYQPIVPPQPMRAPVKHISKNEFKPLAAAFKEAVNRTGKYQNYNSPMCWSDKLMIDGEEVGYGGLLGNIESPIDSLVISAGMLVWMIKNNPSKEEFSRILKHKPIPTNPDTQYKAHLEEIEEQKNKFFELRKSLISITPNKKNEDKFINKLIYLCAQNIWENQSEFKEWPIEERKQFAQAFINMGFALATGEPQEFPVPTTEEEKVMCNDGVTKKEKIVHVDMGIPELEFDDPENVKKCVSNICNFSLILYCRGSLNLDFLSLI